MPNFNKSRGFKMSGYSYPGESPMKGKKKKAQQAEAKLAKDAAAEKLAEFGEMKIESTNITEGDSFKVDQSPVIKRSPAKNWLGAVGNAAKDFAKSELGKEAGKALIGGAVSMGVNAIGKNKEKPKRGSADQSGFAGIKFGK
tara:strand:+ start:518 stop:943 length:426 start_codon:yes stop_codon:yes gene_type:complete